MRVEIPFDSSADVTELLAEILRREIVAILHAETAAEQSIKSATGFDREPQTPRKPQQKHARPSRRVIATAGTPRHGSEPCQTRRMEG